MADDRSVVRLPSSITRQKGCAGGGGIFWKAGRSGNSTETGASCLLASRKEVIQPQVPLRLPCYDFTPVADLTVVGWLPFGLLHRLRVKPTPMV